MNKPEGLETKIFIDSGDVAETREVIDLIGFLDGQTTNPSLIVKNPSIAARLEKGDKLTNEEALEFYKKTVQDISLLIPKGSVSVEVIVDNTTTSEQMVSQGREMFTWIPNAHVKLPTTQEALTAAELLINEGVRVNFTLCFTQAQAAAIFEIAKHALPGQVYVSPFIGRIDDQGENGMDLIKNIVQMKKETKSPVEVLAASIRTLDHLLYSFYLKTDIVTIPLKTLKAWKEKGLEVPTVGYIYESSLTPIPYQKFDLGVSWREYNLKSELTDKGIVKFTEDWNSIIKQ